MSRHRPRLVFALLATVPALAQAHPGHDAGVSFTTGLQHPLGGVDHLLALIAVGLLAARMGGRAQIGIPAAFLTLLGVGIALGFAGVQLDLVEPAIAASIVVCGVLAAMPPRQLPVATAALAALFALFHGNAHGVELAPGMARLQYAVGLMTASALAIAGSALLTQSVASIPGRPGR